MVHYWGHDLATFTYWIYMLLPSPFAPYFNFKANVYSAMGMNNKAEKQLQKLVKMSKKRLEVHSKGVCDIWCCLVKLFGIISAFEALSSRMCKVKSRFYPPFSVPSPINRCQQSTEAVHHELCRQVRSTLVMICAVYCGPARSNLHVYVVACHTQVLDKCAA